MLQTLAQVTTAEPAYNGGAGMGVFLAAYIALIVLLLASMWKIFTKAGKPGWASLVPIYNGIVLLEIVGRPIWWILLMLIPFVNIVVTIIVLVDLAKAFGKGTGFALLMMFLPFIGYPILAFTDTQYKGVASAAGGTPAGGGNLPSDQAAATAPENLAAPQPVSQQPSAQEQQPPQPPEQPKQQF
jgi:hypothetical protein